MKRILCLSLVLILAAALLSGCGRKPIQLEEAEDAYFNPAANAVKAGDHLFFLDMQIMAGRKFHYVDLSSGETMPLCAKPECTHKGSDCMAYADNHAGSVGLLISDGLLYWIKNELPAGGHTLYSMLSDGSGRKAVNKLDGEIFPGSFNIDSAQISNGALFVCGRANTVTDGEPIYAVRVFSQPLSSEKGELIYSSEGSQPWIAGRIHSGYFYFMESDLVDYELEICSLRLFRYDPSSKELICLFDGRADNVYDKMVVTDDGILIGGYSNILKFSFSTGTLETFFSPMEKFGTAGAADLGEDRIICWLNRTDLVILDHEGNEIVSSSVDPELFSYPKWGRSFIGCSGRKAYYNMVVRAENVQTHLYIVEIDLDNAGLRILWDEPERAQGQ